MEVKSKQKCHPLHLQKGRTVKNKLNLIRKLVKEVVLKELTNHSWGTKGLLPFVFI